MTEETQNWTKSRETELENKTVTERTCPGEYADAVYAAAYYSPKMGMGAERRNWNKSKVTEQD